MTDAPHYVLRLARAGELARLQTLEDDAGRMFGEVGIDPDLPGLSDEELERGLGEGLLWVLADDEDDPIAFALVQGYPDALHLRELDVDPTHLRRGLGRRLVEHVRAQATARGLTWVTLTTFADVPWNAPLYRRYGFVELAEAEQPSWLRQIRAHEDRGVLAAWPRVAMGLRGRAGDESP